MTSDDILAEIMADWYQRRAEGNEPSLDELIEQHPELAADLRTTFASMQFLDDAFENTQLLGDAFENKPSDAPSMPESVGPYRIYSEIGRGGMGIVYVAEQASMKRRIALKVLTPSLTNAARSIQRFKREARAAGSLQHTNIVPIYDMGQHAGHWYYAMELVEGRSLAQVIDELKRGGSHAASCQSKITSQCDGGGSQPTSARPPHRTSNAARGWFEVVAAMFAGVAEALELAHQAKIVHRDVKPGNLLLHTDGTLKLVDFGLAHLEDNGPTITRSGDRLGTPAYMSPEQAALRGERVSYRTDIYSLGATLYELLTHRAPFAGDSLAQLCSRIESSQAVRPRTIDKAIPADLETIVAKAMEKLPSDRYATAMDLARDLRAFCEGDSIQARPAGPITRLFRRAKRHKLRTALLTSIVVLGVGGGVAWSQLTHLQRTGEYEDLLTQGQRVAFSAFIDGAGMESSREDDSADSSWTLFGKAIALMPERHEAYFMRALLPGIVADRLRDVDEATQHGLSLEASHWTKAFLFTIDERTTEASASVELAMASPGRPSLEANFAHSKFADFSGDREQAVTLLSDVVARSNPSSILHFLALRERGTLQSRLGRYELAIGDFLAVQSLGNTNVYLRVNIAALWWRLGRRDTANAIIDEIVDDLRESNQLDDWRRLIGFCTLMMEWQDDILNRVAHACEQLCRRRLLRDKLDNSAQEQLGRAMQSMGRHADAIVAYRAAIELGSRNPKIYMELGQSLCIEGNYDEGIAAIEKARELAPNSLPALTSLATTLSMSGRTQQGLQLIQTAVKLHPNKWALHSILAFIQQQSGQLQLAKESNQRAIWLNQDSDRSYTQLASVHVELGDFDAAEALLRKRILAKPDWVHNYTGLVEVLSTQGNLQEVIEVARAASLQFPQKNSILHMLGNALSDSGRFEEAMQEHQKCVLLDAKDRYAHHSIGACSFDLGRHQDAIDAFRKCNELDDTVSSTHVNIAISLGQLGRHVEALKALEDAIRCDKSNNGAYFVRGVSLLALNSLMEAETAFREALKHDEATEQAHYQLGLVYQKQQDWPRAAKEFRAELAVNQRFALAHYQLASTLRQQGKISEAITKYQSALECQSHPRNRRNILVGLAFSLRDAKRFKEALQAHRDCIALAPKDFNLQKALGDCLHLMGRYEAAVGEYKKAVVLTLGVTPEGLSTAYAYLSKSLLHLERPEEALTAADKAVALTPGSGFAHHWRGSTLFQLNKIDDAAAALRKAIELSPTLSDSHYKMALLLERQEKWRDAETHYRAELLLQPRSSLVHHGLAFVLFKQDKAAEAIQSGEEAILCNPRDANAHELLGQILLRAHRFDRAIEVLEKTTVLRPEGSAGWHVLGKALAEKGDLSNAEQAYRKVLALVPGDGIAHNAIGILHYRRREFANAAQAFRKAVSHMPASAMAQCNLGNALLALQQPEKALQAYRAAVAMDQGYAEAHRALGDCLVGQQETAAGLQSLRTAAHLQPNFRNLNNLGSTLFGARRFDEAIEVLATTIAAYDTQPNPHHHLGHSLRASARFAEAAVVFRRLAEITGHDPGWQRDAERWGDECKRMAELEHRLPGVLRQESNPVDAEEAVLFATLCLIKKLYRASTRFWSLAFAANTAPLDDERCGYLYDAACSASLASADSGPNSAALDAKTRTALRQQSLGWLRQVFPYWQKKVESGTAVERDNAIDTLKHWQQDLDLTAIRDETHIEKLAEPEQQACRALWQGVETLVGLHNR